jgi:hypothetical protein
MLGKVELPWLGDTAQQVEVSFRIICALLEATFAGAPQVGSFRQGFRQGIVPVSAL